MADKPTLNTFASNSRLSVTELNANFDTLATAIEASLGRGGTGESPNSMTGDLDLDLNRIKNLGAPIADSDAIRLVDLSDSDATGAATAQLRSELLDPSDTFGVDLVAKATKRFNTYGELKATTSQSDNDIVIVGGRSSIGDGGGGIFYWDSSDLSTEVSSDTQSGIYVAPDSDNTGASGAWVRIIQNGRISAKAFGLIGDDSTDDGPAMEAWIEAVRDNNIIGVLPSGTYRLTTAVSVEVSNPITLEGTGEPTIVFPTGSQIALSGQTISTPSVTATITKGDRSVTLGDTSGVGVGDVFYLVSDKVGSTDFSYNKAEIHVVNEVASSTQLNFSSAFNFDHDPGADTLTVTVYRASKVQTRDINLSVESGATGGFRATGLNGLEVAGGTWDGPGISSNIDCWFTQRSANLYWENIVANDFRYACLPNTCRNVSVDQVTGNRVRHWITPSSFCDGVRGTNMYGESCTGLLDSHASFDVHYRDIESVNEVDGSNLRAIGGSWTNVKIHVDSASAVSHPLETQTSEVPFTEGRVQIVKNVTTRYNSGYNDLKLDSFHNLEQISVNNLTAREIRYEQNRSDTDLYLKGVTCGRLRLRNRATFMTDCVVDKSVYGSGFDYLIAPANLDELYACNSLFKGANHVVSSDSSPNNRRSFVNCKFEDISADFDDAPSFSDYRYDFHGCEFDNVTSFGTTQFQSSFRNHNPRYTSSAELNSESEGVSSSTTDGSGDISVTHGLQSTPNQVRLTPQGTTFYQMQVHSIGASTFSVRVLDAAGAAVTSTAVTVHWEASL